MAILNEEQSADLKAMAPLPDKKFAPEISPSEMMGILAARLRDESTSTADLLKIKKEYGEIRDKVNRGVEHKRISYSDIPKKPRGRPYGNKFAARKKPQQRQEEPESIHEMVLKIEAGKRG